MDVESKDGDGSENVDSGFSVSVFTRSYVPYRFFISYVTFF